MKTITNTLLWSLFLIALALRVGVAFKLEPRIHFDDAVYHDRIAANIVAGRGAVAGETSVAIRMPLYPYLLSYCKTVFPEQSAYILSVRLLQSVLNAVLVFMIFAIVGRVAGTVYGLVAAAAFAFDPLHVVMPSFLLMEAVYAFFLTMFVWAAIRFLDKKEWPYFIVSVIAMVGGLYVRESMFHIIAVCCLCAVFLKVFQGSRAFFLTLFIISILALVPWTLRNYERLQAFVPFTTKTGWTLYDAVNPSADGGTDVSRFRFKDGPMNLPELQDDLYWKQKAIEAIRQDPLRIAYLATKKLKRFWNVAPNASEFKDSRLTIVFGIYYVPLLVFFAIGFISLRWLKDQALFIVSIPIIYSVLLHTIINGSLRYRMPIEPFIIIIAAVGLKIVMCIFPKKKTRIIGR
jgi:hypothetical protein